MDIDIALEGIEIGPVYIRFYSLAVATGAIAATLVALREANRLREDPDHVLNILLVGGAFAFAGARLYHVIDRWDFYGDNLAEIFAVWRGGLGIFGGIAGGIVGLLLYAGWQRLNVLRWLDIWAPAFLLGQAIGRWGNFFNQELYGPPTDLPWGIPIDPEHRVAGYEDEERFHPLFLYESLLNLAGVVLLLVIARRFHDRLLPGDVALMYFIWYPGVRFFLEFLRLDPWTAGGIPLAQWLAAACVIGAGAVLLWRHNREAAAALVRR